MRNAVVMKLALPLLVASALHVPAWAQDQKADAEIHVDLGTGTAVPGGLLTLPIVVSGSRGTQLGRTKNEIRFPNKQVTFIKVDDGPGSQAAEARAEARTEEDSKESDVSVLTVTVEARREIPEAELLYLVFEVNKSAARGSTIKLENRVEAATLDNRALKNVTGKDGSVTVSTFVVGCLLYMH
ncbi:MAG: hypothetical protein HY652_08675 [Acidobacteria bacterium]|nr:hypothetical protein [Acidobacteriota bacterium]